MNQTPVGGRALDPSMLRHRRDYDAIGAISPRKVIAVGSSGSGWVEGEAANSKFELIGLNLTSDHPGRSSDAPSSLRTGEQHRVFDVLEFSLSTRCWLRRLRVLKLAEHRYDPIPP
jgi:hypothetical protein